MLDAWLSWARRSQIPAFIQLYHRSNRRARNRGEHPNRSNASNLLQAVGGDRWANDNYGFVLAAHSGQSQGRPATTTGSQPIVIQRPTQPVISQMPPCPIRRSLRPGNSSAPGPIFMALQQPPATPSTPATRPDPEPHPSAYSAGDRHTAPNDPMQRPHQRIQKRRMTCDDGVSEPHRPGPGRWRRSAP